MIDMVCETPYIRFVIRIISYFLKNYIAYYVYE